VSAGAASNVSIWGGANSFISGGTGANQQIVITGSGTTVVGPSAGTATVSAAAQGTIFSAASDLFNNPNGNMVLAAGQQDCIQLSTGFNVVIGASGDTILADGLSHTDVDGSTGGILMQLISGSSNISGSTSTVAGNTILAGSAPFVFNPGPVAGAADLIQLAGNNATVNAFSFGATRVASPDTIIAGGGSDSVFAGAGDRVGITGTELSFGIAGTHQWVHADTVPGSAVAFGTFDSVAGSSQALVTVGSFNIASDFIFYQNVNAFTTNQIIVTSQATTVGGTPSTILTLPDGTLMTLVGITQAQLSPALFKP